MRTRIVPACTAFINAAVLVGAFYVWRFSYFWIDDFNAFFWIQRLDQSLGEVLWAIVNPVANAFRPFGWLFYWVFWHLFDLNPWPYHFFAWTLHALNVVLVFLLLSKITSSSLGAGAGALLFAFRANFADIYWSFGTIYELLALLLMLLAFRAYSSSIPFRWKIVAVAVLYLFAVKSKEMAITLPAVLLLHEICFRNHKVDRRLAAFFLLLGLFGAAFGYSRFVNMGSTASSHAYYMDFSVLTFGRGYGWYFDHLYGINLRWGAWMIALFFLTVWFVYRRERRGLFFLGYAGVTLLPVIFMVNHRFEFFWYIPFLGVSGLFALFVAWAEGRMHVYLPGKAVVPVSLVMFTLFAAAHVRREWRTVSELVENQKSLAAEYASFIRLVQSMPMPEPQAVVSFSTLPRHFTADILLSATQAALHRTDVSAEVTDTVSDPAPLR